MLSVDEYLSKVEPNKRAVLVRVRQIIKEIVPDAEETISYGMPTYKYQGKKLIYFAVFKDHMSLFGAVKPLEAKLSEFKLSHKGTVQFTAKHPLPDDLVREIVEYRLKEIS